MTAVARKLAVAAGFSILFLFVFAANAAAQTSAIEGEVIGEDGNPVKGALILIERQDIRGTYKVKTNKKGRFFHAGLPLGTYVVKCLINDRVVDQINGVRTTLGEPTKVDFDLQALARKRQALQQAAATGQLTEEQMRGLTPEQREALKRQMEERAKAMRKNKALNDAYNAAMQAKQARQWDVAIQNFQKATEIDPNQHVVWAQLADTYVNKANSVAGPARQEALNKAIEAYQKVLELMPEDAAYHNNFGLVLARAGRLEEAQAELKKAAELNPADAGKYYYNLGAVLVNTGKQDQATEAFKQAIEADPTYANAWFQYGMSLLAKAKIGEDGSIIPPEGTKEALQKYLELAPNGPYAASAQGALQSLQSKVQTEYTNPEAKKKRRKKK